MPATDDYLAIDIGASSGRAVRGSFDGKRLTLKEVHRFPNGPVQRGTGLHWDVPGLLEEIKHSLRLATSTLRRAQAGASLISMGIDTWGVDYGLLSESGSLLELPHHYRDSRTQGMMEETCRRVARERIYERTGTQFLPFNTLYQLLAAQRDGRLDGARQLLFIPDLLNNWLTGIARTESTIASTSQMYDTGESTWSSDLLNELHLPTDLLPPVFTPGTQIGPLLPVVREETGAGSLSVVAPASHDTGSAVVAVPARGGNWAYISSGTWSLVGRELRAPIRSREALVANFTNECGLNGTIRFQKNVAGLWLLQECQRAWNDRGHQYTFDHLASLAAKASPYAALIDPDDPGFADFCDMPGRIAAFCTRTGQRPPGSDGAFARCILESLALKCRTVIDELEFLTGQIATLHIVGGGAHNPLLCQLTADAAERPVLAGPVEATAAGNIMAQAMAHCAVSNLEQIRAVVESSFRPVRYEPRPSRDLAGAKDRFRSLLAARLAT